tara:strand:- start:70 stop:204 length:135 start_codon:yes stop_codon:yes gene_type:complete
MIGDLFGNLKSSFVGISQNFLNNGQNILHWLISLHWDWKLDIES